MDLLDLVRPGAVAGAALTALVGWVLSDSESQGWRLALAVTAIAGIVAASNVHNDRRDIVADRRNGRDRPLADGRLTDRQARSVFVVSSALGLASALALGRWSLVVGAVLLGLGMAYSGPLRQIPLVGHVVVAGLFAAVVGFGAVAAGGSLGRNGPAAAVVVFAFILMREVLKSVPDAVGDLESGARTAAVVLGRHRALALVRVLALVVVLASLAPALFVGSWAYPALAMFGIVGPTLWLQAAIAGEPDDETVRATLSRSGVVFLTGQLTLLALAV
ncbi:MAG: UbiA family prenyltransferase [Actinomycetota bacterium]|nr:UbiA family prenyltransferase [Actinomycetota bacterium]